MRDSYGVVLYSLKSMVPTDRLSVGGSENERVKFPVILSHLVFGTEQQYN